MSGFGLGLKALSIGAKLSGVGGFFKRVPRWVWIALAVVLIAVALFIWHGRQVRAHDKALTIKVTALVNASWEKSVEKLRQDAIALRRKAEAAAAKINRKLKEQHDEDIRHIAGRADGQRVRGPGAAALNCGPGDLAGLPGGAGRQDGAGRPANAGRPGLPAEDRAAVPWPWLVDRAERCDVSRSEVLTWRQWHDQQAAAWEAYRQQLQSAADKAMKGKPDGR